MIDLASIKDIIRMHGSPMRDAGDGHGARGQAGSIIWDSSLPFVTAALHRLTERAVVNAKDRSLELLTAELDAAKAERDAAKERVAFAEQVHAERTALIDALRSERDEARRQIAGMREATIERCAILAESCPPSSLPVYVAKAIRSIIASDKLDALASASAGATGETGGEG